MARAITVKRFSDNKVDVKKTAFAIEYSKDYSVMRAAKSCGIHPDTGRKWLTDEHVIIVLDTLMHERADKAHIDAEWLLHELMDNHYIARSSDNITASNTALGMIGKLGAVDAFAADKLEVATGRDVVERLQRGRKRLSEQKSVNVLPHEGEAEVDRGTPTYITPHINDEKNKNPKNSDFNNFDKNNAENKNLEISSKNNAENKISFF